MAGETLKIIKCEACGEQTAHIKKRGNSALLYVHCQNKDCKHLSTTSAPGIQKKLQAELEQPLTAETSPEWKPTRQTQTAPGAELREKLQPEISEAEAAEIQKGKLEKIKTGGLVLLAIGLAIFGIRSRA